jgi:hypothetical protein
MPSGMSRFAVVCALLSVTACKDKPADQPAAKAAPGDASAQPSRDVPSTPPRTNPPATADVKPAESPAIATADQCKVRGGAVTSGSLRAIAEARKVPADKLDAVMKELETAFSDACGKDAWPNFVLQCIGTSPPNKETYERCMARLPDAKRATWETTLDAAVTKAGGESHPVPKVENATGTAFEELCPVFVAEMARLDGCTGGNMYIPQFENVFAMARSASAGGLIPPDAQPRIKQACDEQAQVVRSEAAKACHLQPPQ